MMKSCLIFIACCGVFLTGIKEVKAQQFINGSFENNSSGGCQINIDNTTFNSFVNNTVAFGELESVDILNNNYCQYGSNTTAQHGLWFLGLDTFTDSTTSNNISLELDDTLTSGAYYNLGYYDSSPFSFAVEKLEIGVSTNDSTFGSLVYTSPMPSSTSWTQRSFTFQAPNNGKYITLRVKVGDTQRWVTVDNFILSPSGSTCNNTYSSISINSCGPYLSPSGNYVWALDGSYMDTIPNFSGCDSIIEIDLSITNLDTNVITLGGNLNAPSGLDYQWIDCQDMTPISGETNQVFSPSSPGVYAVIISDGICYDTSSCHYVQLLNIEADYPYSLQLFPGPSLNSYTVKSKHHAIQFISIYDLNGRMILNKAVEQLKTTSFQLNQTSGIYFVHVKLSSGNAVLKLVTKQ